MDIANIDLIHKEATDARNSGQIDIAKEKYLQVANYYASMGNTTLQANAIHMAGVSCKEGIMNEGDEYFQQATKFYEQAKLIHLKNGDFGNLARVIRDHAITFCYAGVPEKAYALFEQSYDYSMKVNEFAQAGITLDKHGLALLQDYMQTRDKDLLKLAKEKMESGMELVDKDQSAWFYKGTCLLDYSELCFVQQDYENALKFLYESLKIFKENEHLEPHPRRLAQIYALYILIYKSKSQNEQVSACEKLFEENMEKLDSASQNVLRKRFLELENFI